MSEKTEGSIKFELNGKQVNLTPVLPLTIGDIKALKKDGLDLTKINELNLDIEQVVKIMHYICHKANPDVTEADIDSMPLPWINRLSVRIFKAQDNQIPF